MCTKKTVKDNNSNLSVVCLVLLKMSVVDITKKYTREELGMAGEEGSLLPFLKKPQIPEPPPTKEDNNESKDSSVSVYVRVRPLLEEEVKSGVSLMPGMVIESSDTKDTAATALKTEKTTIGGFTGVLGSAANNEDVFDKSFKSKLSTVVEGGTASLFCYGYTGSGKSHTVLGYDGEKGLYHLAAAHLLRGMEEKYPGEDLFLVATACEIYGEQVYDLMGEEKLPATLRTDANGNLSICGPAVRTELSDAIPEFKSESKSSGHATIVTRTRGLRSCVVKTVQDLDTVSSSALQLRVVGSSSEHSQSSRSHALLRMEIMNKETLLAREAVEDAKVLLAPLLSGLDNHFMECYNKLLEKWDHETGLISLKQYDGGQQEWDEVCETLRGKKKRLLEAIPVILEKVKQAYVQLSNVNHHEAVGGSLVLVDLAGADYDKRDVGKTATAQEKKESADINKSLLALKECFRFIAGGNTTTGRAPFRGSKLTRLLEDSLLPGSHSTRQNKSCESVMVVNVSPGDHIAKRTLNVLRYGQIFADGSKKLDQGSSKAIRIKKPTGNRK